MHAHIDLTRDELIWLHRTAVLYMDGELRHYNEGNHTHREIISLSRMIDLFRRLSNKIIRITDTYPPS